MKSGVVSDAHKSQQTLDRILVKMQNGCLPLSFLFLSQKMMQGLFACKDTNILLGTFNLEFKYDTPLLVYKL